jgi:hypothetical protein
MKKYTLVNLQTDEVIEWTTEEVLAEINRDRSEDWIEYTEADLLSGWKEWCEGETYTMITYLTKNYIQ